MEGLARRGRLPRAVTSLVGREAEVREVERLLHAHRLVTLTGAGGSGKTRVAIAVASGLRDARRDGVMFVALQDTRDRDAVAVAIADALGVTERGGADLVAVVEAYLADRDLLLVLDNFEQVLAAAPIVSGLLEAAPGLWCIVTSRAPLRIAGEQEFEIQPVDTDAALRIFVERAAAVRPSFDAQRHAAVIDAITARVDRLPLAVELAAAQVRHLSPEMILARLEGSLPVLEGGHRDAPARQRTQRATLDWSHDLLTGPSRRLLAALSVFAGGWSLDAAERVCADGEAGATTVFSGLTELIESSLVRAVDHDRLGVRYSMHQLTREYAAERLAASPEREAVERRHAAWVLDLVEAAEPHLVLRELRAWQERLRTEEDNIRRALRWTVEHGETELGLRIAGSLWRFWFHWAELREGIAWLEAALALPGADTPNEPRARALSSLAALWWHQGRFAESLRGYLEVVDILRSLGVNDERLGDALDDAVWAAQPGRVSTWDEIEFRLRLAEEKWRYPRPAHSHRWDGWLDRETDLAWWRLWRESSDADFDPVIEAMEAILEAVDRSDQALFAAHARATISGHQDARKLGDLGLRHGRDALRRYREMGHLGQVPIMLLGLAKSEFDHGRPDRTLRLVVAAGRGSEATGGTIVSHRARAGGFADLDQRAAALLPADEVARALREGRAMSTEEAIAYALHELPEDTGPRSPKGRHDLTPREQEVLALVADGRTDGEIAEALVISKKTASVHVASIKGKLGAGSRAEIVSIALRGRLVGDG